MKKIFKKVYFLLFYNTNFVINFIFYIKTTAPLLLILAVYQPIFHLWFLVNYFLFWFLASYFYLVVYLLNDVLDFKKDKVNVVYKNNVFVNIPSLTISHYLICFLFVNFFLLFVVYCIGQFYLILSAIYLFSLIVIAYIHTKCSKIKFLSIFLERCWRYIFPIFLFLVYLGTGFQIYLVLMMLLFPVFIHNSYVRYLEYKLKIKNKIYLLVYLFYYMFLVFFARYITHLFTTNTLKIASYFVLYLVIYQVVKYIFLKFFKMNFLLKGYKDGLNDDRKIVLLDLFIWIFVIFVIWLKTLL